MKKQIFTLLTLLVLCVTGAWAEDVTWTYSFVNGDHTTLNENSNVGTFANKTWTLGYNGLTSGSFSLNYGNNAIKIPNNNAVEYVTFTTSGFAGKKIKEVIVNVKNSSKSSSKGTLLTVSVDGSELTPESGNKTSLTNSSNATDMNVTSTSGTDCSSSLQIKLSQYASEGGNYIQFYVASITVKYEMEAPGAITLPASGIVNGLDNIKVYSEDATTIKYKWTATESEPAEWDNAAATGGEASIPIPNEGGIKYLYVKGNNSLGDGSVSHQQYTIYTTLLHWQFDSSTTAIDSELTANGGTVTIGRKSTSTKTWAVEDATYNAAVPDNMKATGATSKGLKSGSGDLYLQVALTSGNFKVGDIVYVCGYNPWRVSTTDARNADVIASITTGSGSSNYQVGNGTIPVGYESASTLFFDRSSGNTAVAAIKIVRPVDLTPPAYVSSVPAKGATDASIVSPITVTFSENITILNAAKIKLVKTEDDSNVAIETPSASGAVLTVTPSANLANSTEYRLNIEAGAIEDENHNTTTADETITFTTLAYDGNAPLYSSSSPEKGATGVAVDATLTVTYDENIIIEDASQITLKKTSDESVVAIETPEASGAILTITPSSDLANNTGYTLTIGAGALKDGSDNVTTASDVISFTTVKAKLAKPTIVGTSFFKTSRTVTISSIEGATITYSTDGESYSAYPNEGIELDADATIYAKATHDDYLASDAASKKFKKYASLKETADVVSEESTWDWSGISGSVQLKDDGSTFPYKGEAGDIVASNFNGTVFSNVEWGSEFNADALILEAAEYPVRSNYYQGMTAKFITTVPGTVTVWYSNTSNKDVERFLDINGTEYGNKTDGKGSKTADFIETAAIPVTAGLITITGVENHVGTYVHIKKIKFTPLPEPEDPTVVGETVTVPVSANMAGWRSFIGEADQNYTVETGTKVYYASATNSSTNKVTLTEIAEGVPANTPVILYKDGATSITLTKTATAITAPAGNKLQVTIADQNVGSVYRLGYKASDGVGFYKYTSTAAPAGIIYISALDSPANFLGFDFGDTTGIGDVRSKMSDVRGEFFNLAGQKVAQPTKGLYIVNGKKVVLK